MELSQNILKYREQLGLSQEQLAEKLNISPQAIALWETGQEQPTIDTLKILANTFGVSIDQLYGNTQIEETNQPLFTASIKYTEEIYKKATEALSKKHLGVLFLGAILSVVIMVASIVAQTDSAYIVFMLIMLAIFVGLIIRIKININKAAEIPLKDAPNAQANYLFYADHFVANSWSDNTTAKHTKKYSEISTKVHDDKYIYILCNQRYWVIDKSTCEEHLDKLYQLLDLTFKNPIRTKSYSQGSTKTYTTSTANTQNTTSKGVPVLLNLLFVLSILSIFIALIITVASIQASPIPEFPFAIDEHLWKFLLVIPIPVLSIVLGIIYKRKGYKCKKNIVGGIIMATLLFIYGMFPTLLATNISHDMKYAQEISQEINFDIPDDGHISVAVAPEDNCHLYAMIKITNEEEHDFVARLKKSSNWKTDMSFIPANAITPYELAITSKYHYFSVYNTTTNSYNNFTGKLIYMAYNVDTNILYVYWYN